VEVKTSVKNKDNLGGQKGRKKRYPYDIRTEREEAQPLNYESGNRISQTAKAQINSKL